MNEGDEPVDAEAGRFVDQAETLGVQLLQGAPDVGHGKADMVGAFAPPREEASGTAIAICRGEELNRAGSGVKKGDFDAVVGGAEALEEAESEGVTVCCERVVNVLDNDADVVDLGVG